MANDDFYSRAAAQRMAMIEAERAAHLADLAAHRANGDTESAAGVVQALANVEAERQNLVNLHQQYIASQNPAAPPEPSKEERAARTFDRMDWRDIVEMTRQSKHCKNISETDPNMIAGWQEAQRRRARGE